MKYDTPARFCSSAIESVTRDHLVSWRPPAPPNSSTCLVAALEQAFRRRYHDWRACGTRRGLPRPVESINVAAVLLVVAREFWIWAKIFDEP